MKLILVAILSSLFLTLKAQDSIFVNNEGAKVRTISTSHEGSDMHSISKKIFVSHDINMFKGLDFSDILICVDLKPISKNFAGIHNLNDIDTSTTLAIDTCTFIYQKGNGKFHGDLYKSVTATLSDIFLHHFISESDLNIEAIKSGFFLGDCFINGKLEITDNPSGITQIKPLRRLFH